MIAHMKVVTQVDQADACDYIRYVKGGVNINVSNWGVTFRRPA